jgi:ferredoxin/flavodoxin---NADP+ reductase
MLRYPAAGGSDPAADGAQDGKTALEQMLADKGIRPVSYEEWLLVEAAEADLARSLGRGDRVKLHGRDALFAACWPPEP